MAHLTRLGEWESLYLFFTRKKQRNKGEHILSKNDA